MKSFLLSFVFLLILFLVSHYIFEPTYLYYEISWLDIPMHILGGLGVGFLINALTNLSGNNLSFKEKLILFLIVAISWEIYEYIRGVMIYDSLFKYLDTLKDIFMGSLGFYFSFKLIK